MGVVLCGGSFCRRTLREQFLRIDAQFLTHESKPKFFALPDADAEHSAHLVGVGIREAFLPLRAREVSLDYSDILALGAQFGKLALLPLHSSVEVAMQFWVARLELFFQAAIRVGQIIEHGDACTAFWHHFLFETEIIQKGWVCPPLCPVAAKPHTWNFYGGQISR